MTRQIKVALTALYLRNERPPPYEAEQLRKFRMIEDDDRLTVAGRQKAQALLATVRSNKQRHG